MLQNSHTTYRKNGAPELFFEKRFVFVNTPNQGPSSSPQRFQRTKNIVKKGWNLGRKYAKKGRKYTWDKTKQATGYTWDKTKRASGYTWDKTKRASGYTWDKTKRTSGYTWDKTKRASGYTWDKTKRATGYTWDKTKRASGYTWDKTKQAGGYLWNKIKQADDASYNYSQNSAPPFVGNTTQDTYQNLTKIPGYTIRKGRNFITGTADITKQVVTPPINIAHATISNTARAGINTLGIGIDTLAAPLKMGLAGIKYPIYYPTVNIVGDTLRVAKNSLKTAASLITDWSMPKLEPALKNTTAFLKKEKRFRKYFGEAVKNITYNPIAKGCSNIRGRIYDTFGVEYNPLTPQEKTLKKRSDVGAEDKKKITDHAEWGEKRIQTFGERIGQSQAIENPSEMQNAFTIHWKQKSQNLVSRFTESQSSLLTELSENLKGPTPTAKEEEKEDAQDTSENENTDNNSDQKNKEKNEQKEKKDERTKRQFAYINKEYKIRQKRLVQEFFADYDKLISNAKKQAKRIAAGNSQSVDDTINTQHQTDQRSPDEATTNNRRQTLASSNETAPTLPSRQSADNQNEEAENQTQGRNNNNRRQINRTQRRNNNNNTRQNNQNTGNNTAQQNTGNNTAQQNTGNNTAQQNAGNNTTQQNAGNNTTQQNAGNNTTQQNAGNNTTQQNAGNNTTQQNTGNNTAQQTQP